MISQTTKAILYTTVIFLPAAFGAIDDFPYQACPLLRAYYPPPTVGKNSTAIKDFNAKFTAAFDNLVETGESPDYGPITPNTTSFSVVLFSGGAEIEDPIFFEYRYTAPSIAGSETNVSTDTVFPVGSLMQLVTVYAWLVEMGDGEWGTPITEFLPELVMTRARQPSWDDDESDMVTRWEDITIGALAGHMSGLTRSSDACRLGEPCDKQAFVEALASIPPVFLPDSTPVVSNAAFQLLAFALEAARGADFGGILSDSVTGPLNMTNTSLLGGAVEVAVPVFGNGLNVSAMGEPASLSLQTSAKDLARLGQAMLSSKLLPAATTRRWLHPTSDTSNLRNGVGWPWEIYRAGKYANSSMVDVFTKTGSIGGYSSYFGLSPDLDAGFAILAYDSEPSVKALDINVYADIVSETVGELLGLAAVQMAETYGGVFAGNGTSFNVSSATDGPGLVVHELVVGEVDLRARTAAAVGIEEVGNLDLRLYPTNVVRGTAGARERQFVAVVQDRSAPVDMGTPTCITWMDVGGIPKSESVLERVVFRLDDAQGEVATAVSIFLGGQGRTLVGRIE